MSANAQNTGWFVLGEDEEASGWAGVDVHAPLPNGGSVSVCFVKGDPVGNFEGSALSHETFRRAAVISAAPELLAALTAAESLFHHTFAMDGTIHKQMKAAIAKAEGQP